MTCCHKCWEKENGAKARGVGDALCHPMGQPMIVCSICGNKRCPHATDHEIPCTNSNETGQKGSVYCSDKEEKEESEGWEKLSNETLAEDWASLEDQIWDTVKVKPPEIGYPCPQHEVGIECYINGQRRNCKSVPCILQ